MKLIKLLIQFLLLHFGFSEDSYKCSQDERCYSDCNALSNCCSSCKCRTPVKYQKDQYTYGCSTSKCASTPTTYCPKCVDGYYLKDYVCYFCSKHCIKCSSYDVCTQCESQYTIVNSKCQSSIAIPLCVTIYDSNKCSQCVSNAEQYNYNKSCKCKDGYKQDDNSCKQCLTICDSCSGTYNNCQACKSDTHMNPISNGVCTCQDKYYWDGNDCSLCFTECLKCEDKATQCTDCQTGLQLNESNECVCQSGTFKNSPTFPYDCQSCSKNCYYCWGTINDCTQCYQNYVLNTTTKKCECPIGFFEINYECFQCTWPCVQCTSLSSCQLCDSIPNVTTINSECFCQDGYYINQNERTCDQCNFDCKTCKDQPEYCLSCFDGYVMTSQQNCLKCGIKASITYETCKYKDCTDGVWSYGEQCDDGNQTNRDGCQNCLIQDSFYCINVILQPSQCFRCMDNCIKCAYNNEISLIECQKAQSGYFVSNLTKVQKCSDKCLECQNHPTQCLVCRFLNIGKDKLDCQLCEYKDGYYSNFEEQKCFIKCGDSIKADIEECDDGNFENGDGCDRFCKLEKSFNCQNGICNKLQLPEPLGFENQIFDLYTPQRQVIVYYQQLLNLTNTFQIEDIINVELTMMEDNVNYNYTIVQNLDFQQVNQFNLSYAIDIFVNQSISNASVLVTYLEPQKIRNVDNQEQIITQIYIPITKVIVISQAAKQLTQNSVNTSNYLIYVLIGLLITGVLFGGLDIYFNLIDTIQYISYLYYINTIFPFNVNQFFENLNFAQFTIVQDFINLDEIVNVDLGYDLEIHSLTVPFKIKGQGFYSCFLLNFSSIFSVFAVSFCFFILAQLIYSKLLMFQDIDKQQLTESKEKQDKRIKMLQLFSKLKHSLLTWCITVLEEYFFSDILRIFMTTANEYCFIVNLGFKGLDFQTYFGIINSILTFLSFGLYLIITYCSFALVDLKSYAMETRPYQQKYGSIMEGMTFQRYSKYFNPILLIKKFFFMLFLVQLYDCPMIQASQVLILNLSVLIYMVIYFPISDKLELKKQIICETSQTITIMLFSLFCINDQLEFLDDEQKLNIGWLVIANVLMALVTQVVINIMQQWQCLYEKYKFVQQIVKKVKCFWRRCTSKENPSITLFV